jgi:hypothetical protein
MTASTWLQDMPQLVTELKGYEGGEVWQAKTAGGAEVIARRVPLPGSILAQDYISRIRHAQEAASQRLAEVIGAVERDDGSVWILYRPVVSLPAGQLAASGHVEPSSALAVTLGLLQGLAALHEAGLGQEITEDNARVDATGLARLDGVWLPPEAGAGEQVKQAGALLCRLFGAGQEPGETLSVAERQAPGLIAALRGLAAGSARDARVALAIVAEAAGGLSAEAQIQRTQSHLSALVRHLLDSRRAAAPVGPAPPGNAHPPPPEPAPAPVRQPGSESVRIGPRPTRQSIWKAKPPPGERRRRIHPAIFAGAGAAAVLLIAALVVDAVRGPQVNLLAGGPGAAASTPKPTPPPKPPPSFPASAGDVTSIELSFSPAQSRPCVSGEKTCRLLVKVNTNPLPVDEDIVWVFDVTDLCTGSTVEVKDPQDNADVHADAGWPYVYSTSAIPLPTGKRLHIVAKTTKPDVAASPALDIGPPQC